MEQMQNAMLYMLHSMTEQRVDSGKHAEREQPESGGFRKMMEDRAEQSRPRNEASGQTEEKSCPETEAVKPREEEVDAAALQELAALQMLCVDARQVIAAEAEEPQAVQSVAMEHGNAAAVNLVTGDSEGLPMDTRNTVTPNAQSGQVQAEQPVEAAAESVVTETVEPQAQQQSESAPQQRDLAAPEEKLPQDVRISTEEQSEQTADAQSPVFRNVETAPIKVSETAAAEAPAEAQSVEIQIQEKLTEAVSQGETRVELQLEPHNLGKVTIELTQREDGALHIALRAENSQTRILLEKDMPGLQTLLNRNTQQQVQVEVPRPQENQQQDLHEGHQQQNRQRQEEKRSRQNSDDFLNQLRLGLIPLDEAV